MNPTRRDRVRWCKPRASGLPPPSTLLSSTRQRRTTSSSPFYCFVLSGELIRSRHVSLLRSIQVFKISELLLVIILFRIGDFLFMWGFLSLTLIYIEVEWSFHFLMIYFNRWILNGISRRWYFLSIYILILILYVFFLWVGIYMQHVYSKGLSHT